MLNGITIQVKWKGAWMIGLILPLFFSCEKNIDLKVASNESLLVVEAYINNALPEYNYGVLSRSQDYYSPSFQSVPVRNAMVTITEGIRQADFSYLWDTASRVSLKEQDLDTLPPIYRVGVYFDPKVFTNPLLALRGKFGKYYLLQIDADGKKYSAITQVMQPVVVDSISVGYPFVNDSGLNKKRITVNYKDPDTLGNRQFYFWKFRDNSYKFGWAGLFKSRAPGVDDLTNGEYIRLTHPQGFELGDTVSYFMASLPRDVYQFWDSYNKARDNNGPFSTPITLVTNVAGNAVTGCFSGYGISTKVVVIR